MVKSKYYYIMSFKTTTDVMQAEKYAKSRITAAIMPVPHEISSGCGLALRFMEENEIKVLSFCKETPVSGTLYKMYTHTTDGHHPLEKLWTNENDPE